MGGLKKYYVSMAVLAVVGLVAVVWEYSISRGAVNDQQKAEDIIELQSKLDNYHQDKGKLPSSLSDLDLSGKIADRLSDYEYSKTSDSYTVCANFETDASLDNDYGTDSAYFHGKGRQCFTQEVINYDYNFDDLCSGSNSDSYLCDSSTDGYDFNTQDSFSQ